MTRAVSPVPVPGPPSWSEHRRGILDRYLELLRAENSPLLHAGHEVLEQVEAQLFSVIDGVVTQYEPQGSYGTPGLELSASIGRSRANTGIHPSQSLRAASLIFEAAVPSITARLEALGVPDARFVAAVALNRAILDRMSDAATSYVDYLLDKAHTSNRDERRRLSRELHDVAAPAVAVGLQNLELFDIYASTDPRRAQEKLDHARQSLLDALATIRSLSGDARENVAAKGLTEAIEQYLRTIPTDITTTVSCTTDLAALSLSQSEELYLMLREAIRNAVEHGRPNAISVQVVVSGSTLHATVKDDGAGFDVERIKKSSRRVGLHSMHERAALLNAELALDSTPGSGTLVTVKIPLASVRGSRPQPQV